MDNHLYEHPTFSTRPEFLSVDERVTLAYDRAKAVLKAWNLTVREVTTCSKRFWDMQADPILVVDVGCSNILGCHINLFIGTLGALLPDRPDLKPIVDAAVRGDFFGNFLLSEIAHGLDIMNLETTAIQVDDGFILNTPHPGAAKFMPPTTPIRGYPKMAIVLAKLIVGGEERGTHPFLVKTSDAHGMCAGVTSRRLPLRSGSSPLDYAITSFDHVHLPPSAFLGIGFDRPTNRQALLHMYIWRIMIGSMTIPMNSVTATSLIASIGTDYSYRRHIQGKGTQMIPIISFRTQQLPLLYATAIAYVLEAWRPRAIDSFMERGLDPQVRHGLAVVFKTTVCRFVTKCAQDVGERLGAQGTFGHNLISQMELDNRGISIAEGDILVLCIRLFSELLQERYTLPPISHPDTLLSRHSAHIFSSSSKLLSSFSMGHRDERFNNLILPQSEPAIAALGHATAYSSALDESVPQPLLDLFECAVIKMDPAWYAEHAGITGETFREMEDRAAQAALPRLKDYVDGLGVRQWVTAPIVSDDAWNRWLPLLTTHRSPRDIRFESPLARL
ncbi:hypothetical protein NM688_g5795 [Phlebia brevispora]|uniref:Uncharacterized protein n=1 Tax=Phlebia brevispora TaxID=194682 RepID=A0ACC1SPI7_9APHY|nr:hypothetical protein NM688_g5795 [Phlebia brevispora]